MLTLVQKYGAYVYGSEMLTVYLQSVNIKKLRTFYTHLGFVDIEHDVPYVSSKIPQ